MAIERTKYMDEGEIDRLRTVTEAWAIVDLAAGRRQGVLTWAFVDTAMRTGLRVSELARLKVGDLDLKRGFARVHRHKRRQTTREVLALGNGLTKHLAEFIEWKRQVGQGIRRDDALFSGKRGPLTVHGLQRLWHRAIERAGLPAEYSVHSARHTMAVHLLKETRNLRQVQKQLGHSSPTTTANMRAPSRPRRAARSRQCPCMSRAGLSSAKATASADTGSLSSLVRAASPWCTWLSRNGPCADASAPGGDCGHGSPFV